MKPTVAHSHKSDRCIGIKKDGKPCTLPRTDVKNPYCRMHDPNKKIERIQFSIQGGHARQHLKLYGGEVVPVSFRNMDDAYRLLEWAIGDLQMQPRSINRDKAIVNTILVGIKVLEVGGMEERIKRLEKALYGQDIQKISQEASYEIEEIQEGETE
jgi:hypothetical protein